MNFLQKVSIYISQPVDQQETWYLRWFLMVEQWIKFDNEWTIDKQVAKVDNLHWDVNHNNGSYTNVNPESSNNPGEVNHGRKALNKELNMSVISESLENDPIIIISNFVACEYGMEFNWECAREFDIGEEVYFVDFFKNETTKQEYQQWFIKFRTKEGKLYSATQLYFICKYEWQDIIEHIKQAKL